MALARKGRLTLSAHRQVKVLNLAVLAKDLAQVILIDVLGKALNHNL